MEELLKILAVIFFILFSIYRTFKKAAEERKKRDQSQAPQKVPQGKYPAHTATNQSKTPSTIAQAVKKLENEKEKKKDTLKQERHIHSRVYNSKEKERGIEEAQTENVAEHFKKLQSFNEIKNYEAGFKGDEPIFEYPVEDQKNKNPYSELLKSPEGLKQAIILKEIIDRKYF